MTAVVLGVAAWDQEGRGGKEDNATRPKKRSFVDGRANQSRYKKLIKIRT